MTSAQDLVELMALQHRNREAEREAETAQREADTDDH